MRRFVCTAVVVRLGTIRVLHAEYAGRRSEQVINFIHRVGTQLEQVDAIPWVPDCRRWQVYDGIPY